MTPETAEPSAPRGDAAGALWCDPLPAGEGAPGGVRIGCREAWLESLGGEPVGLELLPVGSRIYPGDSLGLLHLPERSVDLRSPWSLRITARNVAALADARLVGLSPSLRGWLVEAVLATD